MRKSAHHSDWQDWLGQEPTASDTITLDKWLKPQLWRNTGLDHPFMWGEVRTRGSLHYKVALDKSAHIHTCTCPQRQNLCIHKIALVAGWTDQLFPIEEQLTRPDWVEERLNLVHSTTPVSSNVKSNPGNNPKIPVARFLEMTKGYAFLEKWLEDQTSAGWRQILSPPAEQVEEAASRLVNFRLSGPAKRLRNLIQPVESGQSQVDRLLATLSSLHLACRSFARYDQLDPASRDHLLQFSGITIRKDQVIGNNPGVKDQWVVLAVLEMLEDDLRSQQTWFIGQATRRFALHLVYAWKREPLPPPHTVGSLWAGPVYFYPGQHNFRIQPGEGQILVNGLSNIDGLHTTWRDIFLQLADHKRVDPWTERLPVWIKGVRLVEFSGVYFIVDSDGYSVPALVDEKRALRIWSLQSSKALSLFGLIIGSAFAPISLILDNTILQLVDPMPRKD